VVAKVHGAGDADGDPPLGVADDEGVSELVGDEPNDGVAEPVGDNEGVLELVGDDEGGRRGSSVREESVSQLTRKEYVHPSALLHIIWTQTE
jgi:hypothetical protein